MQTNWKNVLSNPDTVQFEQAIDAIFQPKSSNLTGQVLKHFEGSPEIINAIKTNNGIDLYMKDDLNSEEIKFSSGELTRLINSIRLAGKIVNHEVNKAGLVDILGTAGEENIQGEDQQKLDVYANEVFIKNLVNREIVCGIASEEEDDFISIQGNNNIYYTGAWTAYGFHEDGIKSAVKITKLLDVKIPWDTN